MQSVNTDTCGRIKTPPMPSTFTLTMFRIDFSYLFMFDYMKSGFLSTHLFAVFSGRVGSVDEWELVYVFIALV